MLLFTAQKKFMSEMINIEVLYALPHEQTLLKLKAPQGCTAAEAIGLSGILERHPDIDLGVNKFGIFGKLSRADTVVRDKDRIEIYRPLIADPKEIRRRRAEQGKAVTAGGTMRSSGAAPRPPEGRESGGVPFTGEPAGGVNSAQPLAGSGLPTFGVPVAGAKGGGEINQGI